MYTYARISSANVPKTNTNTCAKRLNKMVKNWREKMEEVNVFFIIQCLCRIHVIACRCAIVARLALLSLCGIFVCYRCCAGIESSFQSLTDKPELLMHRRHNSIHA